MHAPLTQAEFTHAVAPPHCPLTLQVCTPLFEHCVAPGEQTPAHTPPTQAWFVHALPFCQVPELSHVCGVWPLHCIEPGLHVPEQRPPLQTLAQTVPSTHCPLGPHVWGTRLLHCF